MRAGLLLALGLVALACMAGCANPASGGSARKSVESGATKAEQAGMSPVEIRQAIGVYNLKCARCHKFFDPAAYDNAEWKSWMTKMSRKARLTADQEQVLSRYLGTLRHQ